MQEPKRADVIPWGINMDPQLAEAVLILRLSLVRLWPVLQGKKVDKLERVQRKAMRVIKGFDLA